MVNQSQVITVVIYKREMEKVREEAKKAVDSIKGYRTIRDQRDKAELEKDIFIGLLGEYGGVKHLFGDTSLFFKGREKINKDPVAGDGGSDVLGANIDFKASAVPYNQSLLHLHLIVPEKEYRPETVYVFAGVDIKEDEAIVRLVGWEVGRDLKRGIFQLYPDRYAKKLREINPLLPVRWNQ